MNQLVGKTAFVTGATGFVGGALVHRLIAEGMHVRALARRDGRAGYIRDLNNVEVVMGDLTQAERMSDLVRGCDVVFHVAAATTGRREQQYNANVLGTRHIVQAAADAQVERLVHVSTIAVYGYGQGEGRITEVTPPRPGHVIYNRTKWMAENELIGIADKHALPYSIQRPAMIYGPRSGLWTVQMFKLAARQPMPFVGDGSGTAYPIYVDDVIDLMILQATHPQAVGEIFNCAPDPCPTWRAFLGAYMQLAGHDRWLSIPPALVKVIAPVADFVLTVGGVPQDVRDLIPFITGDTCYSMDKARALLGWEPRVSLEAGMREVETWLSDEGLL